MECSILGSCFTTLTTKHAESAMNTSGRNDRIDPGFILLYESHGRGGLGNMVQRNAVIPSADLSSGAKAPFHVPLYSRFTGRGGAGKGPGLLPYRSGPSLHF
ncbi:hypothetical protein PM082_007463 [Marasmius tenuissimus]|nr:hypothetical protein PM082_007463 [Marasmius tenuissimus]